MRQNGHGAISIEDVRTWIEETGLAIFLPRSAQAGFTAPTFVEAVAGERTTEPTLELIASSEALLVRLEAEGVAVRLNLAGQPGDQPDYVVAGWVLPYIYALRGDRDWRRSPQLTGSRQVSPLAVQVAKHLDTANLTALQLRDALGRETSETAVLRALHELWKQLRVIPIVPEVGKPAAWQPLRQRFQKAIAEGASTSQVTAISVLASIYLQAVIAASMEDVELFLAPLTSRSKIREVVRGLAATRQVHSTSTGHAPLYYVAGTLPDFPAVPSYQANPSQPAYRSSSYRTPSYAPAYLDEYLDGDHDPQGQPASQPNASQPHANRAPVGQALVNQPKQTPAELELPAIADEIDSVLHLAAEAAPERHAESAPVTRPAAPAAAKPASHPAPHRPRPATTANTAHPRSRPSAGAGDDRRRPPAQRNGSARGNNASRPNGASHGNGTRSNGARTSSGSGAASNGRSGFSNGNGHHANGSGHATNGHGSNGHNGNGQNRSQQAGAAKNGVQKSSKPAWGKPANGAKSANGAHPAAHSENRGKPHAGSHAVSGNGNGRTHSSNGAKPENGARPNGRSAAPSRPGGKPAAKAVSGSTARPLARPRPAEGGKRKPATASASKRYSFAGQAKQAPKAGGNRVSSSKPAGRSSSSRPTSSRPAAASSKRRG